MNKNYFLLVAFLTVLAVKAQIVNIPDPNFKAKLLMANESNSIAFIDPFSFSSGNIIDTNQNGEIEVAEALLIRKLNVGNSGISNLTGIEAFVNLQQLSCDHNNLTQIDISALPGLWNLFAQNNQLTTINMTGTNVTWLDIAYNSFTNIDFLESQYLSRFGCSFNQITELDLSGFEALYNLSCSNNQITNLILPQQGQLEQINCSYNQLTTLTYHSGITLNCSHNQLTTIDITPSGPFYHDDILGYFDGSFNPLESITALHSGAYVGMIEFAGIPALQRICTLPLNYAFFEAKLNGYGYANCIVDNACTLAVEGQHSIADFKIYPNPAYDSIQLELALDSAISEIEIYNVVGQSVLKTANVQSKSIDVSKLSSGNYILKIHSDKGISNIKFVKQ